MAPSEEASRKSSPVHAVASQEELGRKEQHMEGREFGKKREYSAFRKPPRRSSDEERTGGLKEETKLSSSTMVTCPSQR